MNDLKFGKYIYEGNRTPPDALRTIAKHLESDDMVESTVLCQAADELDRLRDPWQPIETAPKPYSPIRGKLSDGTEISNMWWDMDCAVDDYGNTMGGWMCGRGNPINPTHWMPLASAA